FIPLQPQYLPLHGLGKLLETTALVARRINPGLAVTGVIISLYDAGTRLAREVVGDVERFLERGRGTPVPWADTRLFARRIRRNVKLAECPSFGRTVFAHDPACHGAQDYRALAREVLGGTAATPA